MQGIILSFYGDYRTCTKGQEAYKILAEAGFEPKKMGGGSYKPKSQLNKIAFVYQDDARLPREELVELLDGLDLAQIRFF